MAEPEKKPAEDVTEIVEEIEVDEDGNEETEVIKTPGATVDNALFRSPEVLAALQHRLGTMIGQSSGYIQSLPKVVKRRIKSLKKLQNEMIKLESKFYEEVHELECKYANIYAPLHERRRDIVAGSVEPTDSDCDWPSDEEEEDGDDETKKLAVSAPHKHESSETSDLQEDLKDKAKVENESGDGATEETKEEENPSGIPCFWLTIFKNVDMLSDLVQEHDEPILKHLNDIKVKFSQSNPMSFTLEFHFEANEYFNNAVLSKEYTMRSEPDPSEPFSYEGPEIIKCKGCTIDWKKGKNVTVKMIKKVQKHRGRGTKRTVTKTVQNDSFFNFFNPPEVPEGEEADEDLEALLNADFEIGHFIRERIVPRAVLYFTGEAVEEDEFEEEGDEDEGDDDDYDEDGDPDFHPGMDPNAKPQECKQQ